MFCFCRCPSSFLLSGWIRRRRVFSSLLFLSGAGETQTPFGGFGVPLVFLHRGRALRPRSVHLHFLLHQGSRPALFFFFLVGARVVVSLVFFSLFCLSVWWSVLGFFGGSSALHARCIMHSLFGGRETIISPLPFIIIVFSATVLSHSVWSVFPLLEGGNAVRFFHFVFFCGWFGVFCRFFTVLLFLGSLSEKIYRERTFVFGCRCWSCVFWCCFAYVFALLFGFSLPKMARKNSLDVRSGVSGVFSLFLWFFRRRRAFLFFLFKRESSGSNRAHPHTHLGCFFLFLFLSRRICLFTLFGRASCFLVFSWGAILGPTRFWDSPGTLLRPFFWTRGGKGVLVVSFCCFFFPFCCVLRLFSHQLEGADPSSYEAYPRVVEPAPRPSEGPGSAVVRARLDTGFLGTFSDSLCSAEGHRDPRDHFWREGARIAPSGPFFTRTFFSPGSLFFFFCVCVCVCFSLSLSICSRAWRHEAQGETYHAHRRADAKPPSPYPLTRHYLRFSGGGSCSSGFFPLPWREFSRTASYLCRGEFGQVFLGPKGGNAVRFFSVLSKSPFSPRLASSRFSSPSWRKFRRLL